MEVRQAPCVGEARREDSEPFYVEIEGPSALVKAPVRVRVRILLGHLAQLIVVLLRLRPRSRTITTKAIWVPSGDQAGLHIAPEIVPAAPLAIWYQGSSG